MHDASRRLLLRSGLGAALLPFAGCGTPPAAAAKARVVVIGGGFGGATAAKYVRLFSSGAIDVTLVEPHAQLVSCPMSNLVLGGSIGLAQLSMPLAGLAGRHGVRLVQDRAKDIDTARRIVTLAGGATLPYDKLVVSPGVDLLEDRIEGLAAAHASGQVALGWSAGEDTLLLRRQLEVMPDGGTFAIAIPELPYRCPPAPYERACQVASYFRRAKPRSKVLVLDANPDVTSKPTLFKRVWAGPYAGMVEYRPQHLAQAVEAGGRRIRFEVQDDVDADVVNVLPPVRAGAIATRAGLVNVANDRWCAVDYRSFESTAAKDVHVLGDSILPASGMPRSAHMANNHGKVAAASIVARLAGWPEPRPPTLSNTCFSFIDERRAMHVATVHEWDAAEKTYKLVHGSGGQSTAPSEEEGALGWHWARNIWADTAG